MSIRLFELIGSDLIPLATSATSLDELTRALPQGFYTTFTTLKGGEQVAGLDAHLQRLYTPAHEKGLRPVEENRLRRQIAGLTKTNLPKESRVRLILTKDDGKIYIAMQPFEPLPDLIYQNGVHVITTSTARHDPRIKDTGFISESAAQRMLVNKNVFEVLLVRNGKVLEGMTSNFYAVSKGQSLVTARYGILLGVTRRAVLKIARGEGIRIEYRAPGLDERFDEAFLTSSSRGIVPIVSIDNNLVGRGSVGKWTKVLIRAYQNYIEKKGEAIF